MLKDCRNHLLKASETYENNAKAKLLQAFINSQSSTSPSSFTEKMRPTLSRRRSTLANINQRGRAQNNPRYDSDTAVEYDSSTLISIIILVLISVMVLMTAALQIYRKYSILTKLH